MANKRTAGGTGTSERLTKAQRKEQARLQRIELERRAVRTRRNRWIAIGGLVLVGVAVAVFVVLSQGSKSSKSQEHALPGLLTGPAPWPANTTDLAARLNAVGLPQEGAALHIHPHLFISVDGQQVTIPADIGLTQSFGSPLHTHDVDGVIHVESADPSYPFTLGDFFDVWGVRFTPTCLGSYCASDATTLRLYVAGRQYTRDPTQLKLKDEQQIVLVYGTPDQTPDPLPTFDFSSFQG